VQQYSALQSLILFNSNHAYFPAGVAQDSQTYGITYFWKLLFFTFVSVPSATVCLSNLVILVKYCT
jgi:hypothetical protein